MVDLDDLFCYEKTQKTGVCFELPGCWQTVRHQGKQEDIPLCMLCQIPTHHICGSLDLALALDPSSGPLASLHRCAAE